MEQLKLIKIIPINKVLKRLEQRSKGRRIVRILRDGLILKARRERQYDRKF